MKTEKKGAKGERERKTKHEEKRKGFISEEMKGGKEEKGEYRIGKLMMEALFLLWVV